jgi:hypothetical protein
MIKTQQRFSKIQHLITQAMETTITSNILRVMIINNSTKTTMQIIMVSKVTTQQVLLKVYSSLVNL